MEKINKRVHTRENLRKKLKTLKINIHQLKYALPITATLLTTSCGNNEKHTPQYEKAKKDLELAKEQLKKAEENMKKIKDYEEALREYEKAKKNLEKAKKNMEEMNINFLTTNNQQTNPGQGMGWDKFK